MLVAFFKGLTNDWTDPWINLSNWVMASVKGHCWWVSFFWADVSLPLWEPQATCQLVMMHTSFISTAPKDGELHQNTADTLTALEIKGKHTQYVWLEVNILFSNTDLQLHMSDIWFVIMWWENWKMILTHLFLRNTALANKYQSHLNNDGKSIYSSSHFCFVLNALK